MKDALTFGSRKKNLSLLLIEVFSTKGISDLETCMDYFAFPGRSCQNLNFPAHLSQMM